MGTRSASGCSNSFRGADLANAVGLLKEEMRRAGSLVMEVGEVCRVPAGGAFAVDRERFSAEITRRIQAHPRIELVSEEVSHPQVNQGSRHRLAVAVGALLDDVAGHVRVAAVGKVDRV